jgi:glucose-1-phosphate thymidylyltransferase
MKVVIPMAGYGTRMRPHTYSRPKPLISVAGYPMLRHLLDTLEGIAIDEYIFIVGYLGDQIEAWINENYDFKATFVVQDELIGQAHAIYLAREYLDGPCIILFSDTLFEAEVDAINQTEADGLVFVQEVEDPRRFGVVRLDDEGRVVQFVEKPDSMELRDAVIGLYYIRDSKALIRAIETQMERNEMTKGEFYLADAFQIMIDEGADFRVKEVDVWLDTGKPETVLETNRWLLDHGHDNTSQLALEGVTIVPPVYIHPEAAIRHAVIGPYASVGKGCRVENSIVTNSIIDDGAVVLNVMLEESLIGRDAHVEGRYVSLNVGDSSSVNFDSC